MPTTLLCVAEKNDAAAKLAQVMSNNTARKRAGLCRYARTSVHLPRASCHYRATTCA
jgi:hypothetical protein